jgi:hypothetical protein
MASGVSKVEKRNIMSAIITTPAGTIGQSAWLDYIRRSPITGGDVGNGLAALQTASAKALS